MYSRNYGRGDIPAKINLPPSYSGSAIQEPVYKHNEEKEEEKSESPCPSNIQRSEPIREEHGEATVCKVTEHNKCETPKKEKSSFLSGFFSDIETEDLILIGIIAALIFDLADKDILLVALVIAAVLM